MRIRADSVVVSSVLHTIALLYLIQAALWNYFSGRNYASSSEMDLTGWNVAAQTAHLLGVACLAVIVIGLIVVWTGYIRRSRSAWLVLFVIVWLWAYPIFVLPFLGPVLRGRLSLPVSEVFYNAVSGPGFCRSMLETSLIFSIMVIALVLPIRRFLMRKGAEQSAYRASPRLATLCVSGVLIILIALYACIRVGFIYQIPVGDLNSTQRLAPPPPPHGGD
jgi:hypothetical protein